MHQLQYRRASTDDIDHLVLLLNQAYRTHTGSSWTSEQDLVVGDRINQQQLLDILEQQNFYLAIAEIIADFKFKMVACIGLTFQQNSIEIGTFCVASDWQNQGIGKQILEYAEKKGVRNFSSI